MASKTVLLLVVGTFCLSFSLLARPLTPIPAGPGDYIKGPGLAFIQHKPKIKYQDRH